MTNVELHYAPEIEQALVSLLWQRPSLLGTVLKKLDPEVHLSQPHLRVLLETISYCYSQLGGCDWASVIEALTQLDKLEECGGKQTLDEIFKAPGYESLLAWYTEMLLDYAQARSEDPPRRSAFFSGGKGQLFSNKAKTGYDVAGSAVIAGKSYQIKGWSALDYLVQKCLDLRFYPK